MKCIIITSQIVRSSEFLLKSESVWFWLAFVCEGEGARMFLAVWFEISQADFSSSETLSFAVNIFMDGLHFSSTCNINTWTYHLYSAVYSAESQLVFSLMADLCLCEPRPLM